MAFGVCDRRDPVIRMTTTQVFSGLHWGRVLLAGLMAFAASMLITVLIVTGYAFKLGFEARGTPDPAKISEFARAVGPSWGPVLLAALTALGALLVARRTPGPVRHGALVGMIAAVAGLIPAWPLDWRDAGIFTVVVVAGLAGGVVGGQRRRPTGA